MSIASIRFTQSIPVLGTSLRLEEFTAESGWTITLDGADVLLYRAAIVAQNVREVPWFRVVGAAYCVPGPAPLANSIIEPAPPQPEPSLNALGLADHPRSAKRAKR